MNYHVLTLFPEMILQGLNTSIIGRAIEKGILSLEAVNIRDYAGNRYGKVDDYPYGGGAGMVMQAEPVYAAVKDLAEKAAEAFSYGDNMRAGGEYRKHLAQVSIRRLMDQISREEEK